MVEHEWVMDQYHGCGGVGATLLLLDHMKTHSKATDCVFDAISSLFYVFTAETLGRD